MEENMKISEKLELDYNLKKNDDGSFMTKDTIMEWMFSKVSETVLHRLLLLWIVILEMVLLVQRMRD